MKQRLGIFAFFIFLLVLSVAAVYAAGSIEQADLTSYGEVYEINHDDAGTLYISDTSAGEIWRLDPSDSSFDIYTLSTLGVQDARPDGSNRIWFTDGASVFGFVDTSSPSQTIWEITAASNLWGLAFDGSGNVWMTESFGSDSMIYRFNPSTKELCEYELPGGSASYYILYDDGYLWLANSSNDSIIRYQISTRQATRWMIGESAAPKGIALDDGGDFWWADSGLGALAQLDASTGKMAQYTPPLGTRPWSVIARGSFTWYTENLVDTVGYLDPAAASSSGKTLTSSTIDAAESCASLGAGTTSSISSNSGTLSWSQQDTTLAVDQDGWKIYQLPNENPDPLPYDLSASGEAVYITDQGRQKLLRFPEQYELHIYLPLLIKE
jgi:streptogramin lyase